MGRIDRQINLPVKGVFMALNFAAVFYAISNCSMLIQILSSPNRQSFDMSCESLGESGKSPHRGASIEIARVRKHPSPPTRRDKRKGHGRSQGTNGRGQLRGCASTRFSVPRGDTAKVGGCVRGPIRGGQVPQPRGKIRVRALRSSARFTET